MLLVAPPAAADHVGGRYQGPFATAGAGQGVTFRVGVFTGATTYDAVIFFSWSGLLGTTDGGQRCHPMVPPSPDYVPIINHAFSDTTPPATFSGSFSAPASASGVVRITTEDWVQAEPGSRRGMICDTGDVGWTASCQRDTPVDFCGVPPASLTMTIPAAPILRGSLAPASVSTTGKVGFPLTIGCPPPGPSCVASVVASARIAAAAGDRVILGHSTYSVASGAWSKAKLALTRRGRVLLRRLRRIRANVAVNVSRGGGSRSTSKKAMVRLNAPRRARRHG